MFTCTAPSDGDAHAMAISAHVSPASLESRGICVSVVSHGQGDLLDRLLGDIAALPMGTVDRVVVTLNLRDDPWATSDVAGVRTLSVVRNDMPRGFAANHNQAFRLCEEPLFAVVNPDIRLASNPFLDLVSRLGSEPRCAMVAPIQVDAGGQRESFARTLPTPWNVALRRLFQSARSNDVGSHRVEWLAGAFMLWRATAFRELGGFDDRYKLYCEDVDICLRLQLRGQRFAVVETARVVHAAQRASRRSPRLFVVHTRSLLRLWLSPVFWRYVLARERAIVA